MKYIIANWKMNMNLDEVDNWMSSFKELIKDKKFKNKIIIAPAAPYLYKSSQFCTKETLECASQDVSSEEKGAHTGDIGAFEIKDYCQYSIVGHSERKEDKKTVLEKRDVCLKNGITPIVCFVKKGDYKNFIKDGALLAWEDPENISKRGIYREKDPKEIHEAYKYFETETPDTPVIYGGSVNRDNADNLTQIKNLGGALIGNASLDPKHFLDIIEIFE